MKTPRHRKSEGTSVKVFEAEAFRTNGRGKVPETCFLEFNGHEFRSRVNSFIFFVNCKFAYIKCGAVSKLTCSQRVIYITYSLISRFQILS